MSRECHVLSEDVLMLLVANKDFPGRETAERHVRACPSCLAEMSVLRRHGQEVAEFMRECDDAIAEIDKLITEEVELERFERQHGLFKCDVCQAEVTGEELSEMIHPTTTVCVGWACITCSQVMEAQTCVQCEQPTGRIIKADAPMTQIGAWPSGSLCSVCDDKPFQLLPARLPVSA